MERVDTTAQDQIAARNRLFDLFREIAPQTSPHRPAQTTTTAGTPGNGTSCHVIPRVSSAGVRSPRVSVPESSKQANCSFDPRTAISNFREERVVSPQFARSFQKQAAASLRRPPDISNH